jgi:hypothetical protein
MRSVHRWLPLGAATLCLLLAAAWLLMKKPAVADITARPCGGVNFLFCRKPVTRGEQFCKLLADLPENEGIMAPVGLTPEIVYLTGKRVIALPFEPELIERFASEYRITRIVVYDETMQEPQDSWTDKYSSALATRFVLEHPERFEPLAEQTETYPAFYSPNTFYLFKVAGESRDKTIEGNDE